MQSSHPTSLYSFDVFDTVITRTVAKPTDVFQFMQSDLLDSSSGYPEAFLDNFPRERIQAEVTARRLSNREDITISEIYAVLAGKYQLTDTQKEELVTAEISRELQLIVPIRATIDAINRIRADHKSIIFISDMYLPKHIIQRMLVDTGAYKEGDELYVSSDIGLTKATGNLYRYVLDRKNCSPEQLIHYGDNRKSDVRMPRSIGIRINISIKNNLALSSHETVMSRAVTGPHKLRSAVIGIARASRLNNNFDNQRHKVIWDTASNIIGPAFYFYVWWILKTASRHGIECLYFMARDGHILYRIARIIEEKFHYGIELRYLYVSREALLIPAISRTTQFDLSRLITHMQSFSVRSVCETLAVNPEKIASVLERYGFAVPQWDRELSKRDVQRFLNCFKEESVRTLIADGNQDRYLNALGYLKQEGMSRNRKFALVDIGWEAHSQLALSGILHEENERPEAGVTGFYFGFGRKLQVFGNDNVFSFCADNNIRKVLMHYGIFEVFAAADHGKTTGYKFENNAYVPVLNSFRNKTADEWGISVQQQGILNFCKIFSSSVPAELYDAGAIKDVIGPVLFRFHGAPSREEAEVYGGYLFSGYLKETGLQDIAPRMSRNELWGRAFKGDKLVSLWFPATFVRSNLTLESYLWRLNMLRRGFQSYLQALYGPYSRFYFNRDLGN